VRDCHRDAATLAGEDAEMDCWGYTRHRCSLWTTAGDFRGQIVSSTLVVDLLS
jgi:hypothetical protein